VTTHATPEADVIVVGAGPGGSAAAYHLASRGLDVVLLEKTRFPREKVCGDGLTPRAVAQLLKMGVDTSESAGWIRNRGLRVVADDIAIELDWPELQAFPNYGLTRTRLDFDQILADRAVAAGASLECGVKVTAPVFDLAGRVCGVTAVKDGEQLTYRAPLVIAADGVSGRLALALGLKRDEKRPMGVAVRQYYKSPAKHDDEYLESWLALRTAAEPDVLQPGYGWIFGLGDGRVNVGLGVLNSSEGYGKTDYRALLRDWLANTPEEWGLADEANADGPVGGAARPPGFPWASTGPRTTAAASCSSATPAAWSTRSTARASPTPSKRARSPQPSSPKRSRPARCRAAKPCCAPTPTRWTTSGARTTAWAASSRTSSASPPS
jgi:menaquinone-9 beta-reductase